MSEETFAKYFINNPDIWFNPQKKYDSYISSKYKHLLDNCLNLDHIHVLSDQKVIEAILIFDQLSYYVHRDDTKMIKEYQKISYSIAKTIIDSERFSNFTDIEKCFIMMPFRHSNKITDNQYILEKIKGLIREEDCSIYRRFYRATLQRLGILINDEYLFPVKLNDYNFDTEILDENCPFTSLIDIKLSDNELIRKVKSLLFGINNIAVSISGGVDSVVLLYILKFLKKDLIAIHINYKNRETSDQEMNNVIDICNSLDIPIFVREINEVKRGECYRETYETVTRKIRFDFYKKVIGDKYLVALGHNRDDCIENIFSNIIKEKKYDNLRGMIFKGEEDDVPIIRPFIDIFKKEIYQIANINKLPYFYDSTPDWSERGKKRDILMPFLDKFDSRIIPGLEKLSNHISSMNSIYMDHVKLMVEFSDDYLCKLNPRVFEYDYNFLNSVFSFVCKEKKIRYFSQKCLKYLHENITTDREIILSNGYYFINYIITN